MSKLQFKKYIEKLSDLIGSINWRRIQRLAPPVPAKREFIDIPSTDLSDMVCPVVEMRDEFRLIADRLGGKEFEPMFEEFDRLIQRTMVELFRRGNLSERSISYLVRLVNSDVLSDQLGRAS